MRIARAVLLPAALCLVFAGCPSNDPVSEPGSSPAGNPPDAPTVRATAPSGPIEVSAEDLFAAYDADAGAADERYKGKTVVVAGVVAGLEKNLRKQHLVSLAAGEDDSVLAILASSENESGSYLRVGDAIVVAGTCAGKGWMTIEVHDGVLKSPVDRTRPAAVGRMDGDVFVRPDLGIRLPLPEGWNHNAAFPGGLVQTFEPVESEPGRFRYPGNITAVWFEAEGMSLEEQARLVAEGIPLQKDNAEVLGTENGEIAGHAASFVAYTHGSPGMPAFELAVTIRNGKRFLRIVGSGPAAERERYEKLFREVAGNLTWE